MGLDELINLIRYRLTTRPPSPLNQSGRAPKISSIVKPESRNSKVCKRNRIAVETYKEMENESTVN